MKKILTWLFILSFINIGYSQIEYPGTPLSFSENIRLDDVKLKEYYTEISENDFKTDSSRVLPIGNCIDAKFDLFKECNNYFTTNKNVVCLIRLKSKNAFYLDIGFDSFQLSENAKVYVYSKNREYILGAFTHLNNRKNFKFQTAVVKGEEIFLEFNCPKNEFEQNTIMISSLTHYFKDWIGTTDQLPCNNHVNCSRFDPFCNQIRSVAKFTFMRMCEEYRGKKYVCSGALMNNANYDFTPYYLTAEHCTYCDVDWDKTVFYFNAQSPNCRDERQNNWYTVQGAKLLTACGSWAWNTTNTDVSLVQLNDFVPLQYNAFYAGYDTRPRGEWDGDDYVTCIHHPKGGVKRISHGRVDANFFSWTWAKPGYWHVCYYDGITQGGSSGSPVFLNKSKRVIGVTSHSFNSENCDGDLCDYVGKLNYCWHDAGTQGYLGKGIATEYLNGADPILHCLPNIELNGRFRDAREYRAVKHQIRIQGSDNTIIGNRSSTEFEDDANFIITSGNEININGDVGNVHFGATPSQRYDFDNVELDIFTSDCISSTEECGINYLKMANAGSNTNNTFVEKEDTDTEIKIHPNPTTQNSTLTLVGYQNRKVEILVLDQSGKTIFSKTISKVESKEQTTEIESKDWTKGIYIVRVVNEQDTKALKLIKQ